MAKSVSCMLGVFQPEIGNGEGMLAPAMAQNQRIAIQNLTEKEDPSVTLLFASRTQIHRLSVPFSNEELPLVSDRGQNKPIRVTKGVEHITPHLTSTTTLPGALQSLLYEKESNSSLVTDEFGNMAYITCGDEFKERFVVQSPFPTPSSWSQSVILPSTRKVVTATEGGKGWYLVDTEVEGHLLRHVSTFQSPTAISAVNSSTLILSEYNQLSIWDIRADRPLVQRLTASESWIYALGFAGGDLLFSGGESRTVQSIDTRKWQTVERWQNCLKYEITSIQPSHFRGGILFVSGVDGEVVCDRWDKWSGKKSQSFHTKTFKGDSTWCGLTMHDEKDLLVGINANGNIYVFNNASSISTSTPAPI